MHVDSFISVFYLHPVLKLHAEKVISINAAILVIKVTPNHTEGAHSLLVIKITPNHAEGAHSLLSVSTRSFCFVFLIIWLNLKESVECFP